MSVPILVVVPWASGGRYDSYRLSNQGQFYGKKYRSGFAYMENLDSYAGIDDELPFMACRNQEYLDSNCATIGKPHFNLNSRCTVRSGGCKLQFRGVGMEYLLEVLLLHEALACGVDLFGFLVMRDCALGL